MAWWLWIDAYTYTRSVLQPPELKGTKLDIGWAAGIISTLGLAMVNVVPAELLTSSSFGYEGHEGRARLCFVLSLMTTFGGLTSSIVCADWERTGRGSACVCARVRTSPYRRCLASHMLVPRNCILTLCDCGLRAFLVY